MIAAGTVVEALAATAERGEGEYVFHLEEGTVRLSIAELAERALHGARRLRALGVEPGEPVGLFGPNRPEWVVWAFAIWLSGAVLVPVQRRLRIPDAGAFSAQVRALLAAAGCRRVLVAPELAGLLPPGVAIPWAETGERSTESLAAPSPDDAAVIQFTSGSTSVPRGALLDHAAVMAQMRIVEDFVLDGERRRSSIGWAPFFHDLGLFIYVLPSAVWGTVSHHLPTERFARDPVEWLRMTAALRASVTIAPSSGLASALGMLRRRGERIDLSGLEALRFAAEAVDPRLVEDLIAADSPLCLGPKELGSSYGMAEAVLAVAYSVPGSGLRLDRISLDALASEGVAAPAGAGPARALVACGEPKTELRIVGPAGGLPERHVGEIHLRGPSLMRGYVSGEATDPFVEGWLRTGDMGYMADGQLYVVGRVKDIVIAMGDNYYPEDFEWAAGRVQGVRAGRCAAFGMPGTEDVVVLAEVRDGAAPPGFAAQVADRVADAVGIRPREVVLLPPGSIEKTTSGKLRRAAMRESYLGGKLPDLTARASAPFGEPA